MVKKSIVLMAMLSMLVVGVYAQRGLRANLSLHGNFGSGINDIPALEGIINSANQSGNYASIAPYIPSFGIGLCGGYSGRLFLIDANVRLNYGTTFGDGGRNRQFDKLAYLSAGFRLLKLGFVELDLKLGYGVSFTNFSLPDIDSRFKSSNMIMPLSTTFWIGRTGPAHRRVGLTFEYIFAVGNLHDIKYDGVFDAAGNVIHELCIAPSTMNVALRYQF